MLNIVMCKYYDVPIRGIILNRVLPEKIPMIREYFSKALNQSNFGTENIPLLGVVPDLPSLQHPCMLDFEELLGTKVLCGEDRVLSPFKKKTLVTSGLRRFLVKLSSNDYNDTLFVTHASRNDIILGFLSHGHNFEQKTGEKFGGGMVLTGLPPIDQPQDYILDIFAGANLPVLYSANTTYNTMNLITNHTSKHNSGNPERVKLCAEHYESHLDFTKLLGIG